jgi:hypothetical protein
MKIHAFVNIVDWFVDESRSLDQKQIWFGQEVKV